MLFHQWFRNGLTQPRTGRISRPRLPGRGRLRPRMEQCEDRTLLTSYMAGSVSDLIKYINAANTAGGTNTISLTAPGASPYVLTAVDNTTDGATGLPVISGGGKNVAADILNIIGNGDTIERSTASGTPAFRLFDVPSGASLTLQNLTLQNGLAFGSGTSAEGGAIYNTGTLVLIGVKVQANVAQGSNGVTDKHGDGTAGGPAAGGGIWSNGSLTLGNGTLVQNNQAIGGTGGFATGSRSINQLKPGVGGNAFGAGVFLAGGAGTFTGVAVDNNVAVGGLGGAAFNGIDGDIYAGAGNGSGGGVYIAAGTVALSSDTVDGNQAEGGTNPGEDNDGSAYGGGIYLAAGTVTLSNDTVAANSAAATGGTVSGGNLPQAAGGGIYIASTATATFCNDTVESNSAATLFAANVNQTAGAGIYIAPGATVFIDLAKVDGLDPTVVTMNTDNPGPAASTDNIDGAYILQNC
jgi:hypothetical protein